LRQSSRPWTPAASRLSEIGEEINNRPALAEEAKGMRAECCANEQQADARRQANLLREWRHADAFDFLKPTPLQAG